MVQDILDTLGNIICEIQLMICILLKKIEARKVNLNTRVTLLKFYLNLCLKHNAIIEVTIFLEFIQEIYYARTQTGYVETSGQVKK